MDLFDNLEDKIGRALRNALIIGFVAGLLTGALLLLVPSKAECGERCAVNNSCINDMGCFSPCRCMIPLGEAEGTCL